jgi:hypothetical protein
MDESQMTDRSALMLERVYRPGDKKQREEMKKLKNKNRREIE